ncbi:MAG: hypothetical protein H6Q21_1954 [Bacteroidetes bacterium]|nr:hypothetical protein [Bacteroidota bacterium]
MPHHKHILIVLFQDPLPANDLLKNLGRGCVFQPDNGVIKNSKPLELFTDIGILIDVHILVKFCFYRIFLAMVKE